MKLNKKPYKGCRDFFPENMRIRDYLFMKMKEVCESYSYEPYDGPLLEELALYKAKSGEELINEQIYSFTDRGNRDVAIRPEMTPTLARMVAQVHRETVKPMRWYSIPNLMRYERPQRGRVREHWQLNADIFGAANDQSIIEITLLINRFFTSLGAAQDNFSYQVNDRMFVDALFEKYELSGDVSYKIYKIIDQSKKISPEALMSKLEELNLNKNQVEIILQYLNIKNFEDLFQFADKYDLSESLINLKSVYSTLTRDFKISNFNYDPQIIRGLDYYTGIVFEIFDQHPDNRRAIAGGGSYSNLMELFNEPQLAGVGFGMGDVTLKDFLEVHNLLPDFKKPKIDFAILSLEQESLNFARVISEIIISQKYTVDVHPNAIKFNKVSKVIDKKDYKYQIILGTNEILEKKFEIKNISTKNKKVIDLKELESLNEVLKGM